jgi:hypothetical protein
VAGSSPCARARRNPSTSRPGREVNSMADKKREEKKDVGKKPDKEKETK